LHVLSVRAAGCGSFSLILNWRAPYGCETSVGLSGCSVIGDKHIEDRISPTTRQRMLDHPKIPRKSKEMSNQLTSYISRANIPQAAFLALFVHFRVFDSHPFKSGIAEMVQNGTDENAF